MANNSQEMLSLELDILPISARDSRARAAGWKRNQFRVHQAPSQPMSKSAARFPIPRNCKTEPPTDLRVYADWFYQQHEARERFRWALRDSLDEIMDGQRTGRWCYQHLSKTEKTHLGTAVEVNLTKEFNVTAGQDLDWSIAGADLDCKFSKDLGGWEIPMEMYLCADHGDRSGRANHAALLVWFDDDRGQWAAGLIRVTDDRLRWKSSAYVNEPERAYNRDNKRKIAQNVMQDIYWLWGGLQDDLPGNLLLHLDADRRGRIFENKSGQQRVNQLFREVAGRVIGRHTILTVAQQDDSPKRARDARKALRSEGFVVLGYQEPHPEIAGRLGLTVPVQGEWISARLTVVEKTDERPKVWLEGRWWAIAHSEEPLMPAPVIPRRELPAQPQ